MQFRHIPHHALWTLGAVAASCTPFKDDARNETDSDAPLEDAASPMATDAGLPCDVNKPFGPSSFVSGLTAPTGTSLADLRLAPDYRTGYFAANYHPNSGGSNDIYTATRTTELSPFANVAFLGGTTVTSSDYDASPTVSADGLTIFFGWSALGTAQHIAYATRSTTSLPFSYVGVVPNVNDFSGEDRDPFLLEQGQALYFASSRVAADNDDVFRATWNGSGFDAPRPLSELNTPYVDAAPVVTPDDLTLFFASARPDVEASGDLDIWTTTRASPNDPFSPPTIVTELNTTYADRPTFITRDGCTLYFSVTAVDPDEVHAEYVAQRPLR